MTLPGTMPGAPLGSLGPSLGIQPSSLPNGFSARAKRNSNSLWSSPAPLFSQSTLLELDVVELSSASVGSLPFQQCPQTELNLTPFRLSWGS